jgi:hypothetical protein
VTSVHNRVELFVDGSLESLGIFDERTLPTIDDMVDGRSGGRLMLVFPVWLLLRAGVS